MTFILQALIRFYQKVISPLIGPHCRFYPTCSVYMSQAIEIHGPVKGLGLGMRRLSCCHPWSKRPMIDPVPPRVCAHHDHSL